MPVVISVILFIFYYIIDNIGFKMARDGIWEAWGRNVAEFRYSGTTRDFPDL